MPTSNSSRRQRVSLIFVNKPEKQLFYRWVLAALGRFPTADTCLDICCGDLQVYPYIKARRYIGIDRDLERLTNAVRRYPKVEPINGVLEDLDLSISGDLVICLQALGNISKSENERLLDAVAKCIAATRPGGRMILDIGDGAAESHSAAAAVIKRAFAVVDERPYGAFEEPRSKLVSWLISSAMMLQPKLAVSADMPRVVFICEGRLPS